MLETILFMGMTKVSQNLPLRCSNSLPCAFEVPERILYNEIGSVISEINAEQVHFIGFRGSAYERAL